ncbi:uncharacterized protein N7459_005873 [Penicillium hispanicum]|uniref:uncharacterized protein n=1 Tax=Penicillium hispanicum TaxID=1080232 RepID=UPI0025420C0D|nr:uncharacterized protein N7459_005873 [Penicillium hispanicum]KAJ5579888.1 hypothetical protein N7459_005873 [Penicillium hispanicum]
MGNASSTAVHDCLLAAVDHNTDLAAFRGDSLFQSHIPLYNLNFPVVPTAIIFPETSEQVAEVVRCAASNGSKVQAYSGGHSYGNYGLGGNDGAIVVNLKNMQQFSMDARTNIATVGAGTKLGPLQTRLYNAGHRAVAHGSCPQVGIGGHFTIGGLGAMSRQWGAALDHVVEAEVVLANATIVTASDTQNQELFFAIKGAAASFGIVTEFKLRTHPAPPEAVQWSFTLNVGSTAEKARLFRDWQDLISANNLTRKFSTELVLFELGALVSGTFLGSKEEFDDFKLENHFPLLDAGNIVYLTDWIGMTPSVAYPALSMQSPCLSPREQLIPDTGVDEMLTYIDNTSKGTLAWFIIFDLEGGAINDVPTNATAYAHRETIMWMQSYAVNPLGSVSETTKSFLDGLNNVIASTHPRAQFGSYPGYVDPWMDNAQHAYWGPNLPKLQQIKTAIDPNDLFHNPQSVPVNPKIT